MSWSGRGLFNPRKSICYGHGPRFVVSGTQRIHVADAGRKDSATEPRTWDTTYVADDLDHHRERLDRPGLGHPQAQAISNQSGLEEFLGTEDDITVD